MDITRAVFLSKNILFLRYFKEEKGENNKTIIAINTLFQIHLYNCGILLYS